MEYIILAEVIITIILLAVGLQISLKKIKNIREINGDKSNIELVNKFPSNTEIAKEVLDKLENKDVKIKEAKDSKTKTSTYFVMSNTIEIGNINNSFTRIQTTIHECIHSVQNKNILKFNYIFSNLNNLYFIIIFILSLLKVVNKEIKMVLLVLLVLMQFVFYIVRSFLETEAMVRAEYVTKEYIQSKNILNKSEEEKIINDYKKINKEGIKFYNFILAIKCMIKIIICTIA